MDQGGAGGGALGVLLTLHICLPAGGGVWLFSCVRAECVRVCHSEGTGILHESEDIVVWGVYLCVCISVSPDGCVSVCKECA